jgi:hypothetical protein
MKNLRVTRKLIISILMIMILVVSMTACGKDKKSSDEKDTKNSGKETEGQAAKDQNAEASAVDEDGSFCSADEKIEITFPDGSWSCTNDTENMKTFESDGAIINVIYAEGDDIGSTMVPSDEEAYRLMVNGGMADLEFDIVHFETGSGNGAMTYKGAVHYTGADNPDKYTVHYGIYQEKSGYTATAVLAVDDEERLNQLEEIVYSMKVMK